MSHLRGLYATVGDRVRGVKIRFGVRKGAAMATLNARAPLPYASLSRTMRTMPTAMSASTVASTR